LSPVSYPTFWAFDGQQTVLASDSGTVFPASTPVMDDQAYRGHSRLGFSFFPAAQVKRNAERNAFRISPFVTLLNRSGQEMQIRIATTDGFRFSLHMIRVFRPGSKLYACSTRHAKRIAFRRSAFAHLGKEGAQPLPLHPSPFGASRPSETVPVSEPSAVRP